VVAQVVVRQEQDTRTALLKNHSPLNIAAILAAMFNANARLAGLSGIGCVFMP
jgi:hypothetical protein